jgi:hypothetical protein
MPNIRHASAVKPITVPIKASVAQADWDRVQSFSPATSQPSEKLYEIGRLQKMTTYKDILEATLSITQLEYGTIEVFKQLAGLNAEPGSGFALSDFDDALVDFYLPGKDEYAGTVEQTLWLQHMALDSFGISMNANERIERTFGLSGEFAKILKNANKYLIFKSDTAPSGTSGAYNIVVSDPAPVVSPNQAGVYILDLWRIRAGVATQLDLTTDYTYTSGTTTISILSALASDNYRIFYSAGSYGTAGDPTSLNDSDDYYLKADNVTITIDDGTHTPIELDKLTSFGIDVTMNRINEAVIGSNEKILKDVESYDVSLSLDGFVKNSTIEEALMAQAGQSWGIIDFTLFQTVTVTVKIYQEATKTNFLIGYQATDCEFSDESQDYTANAFASNPISLTTDNLKITTVIGNL